MCGSCSLWRERLQRLESICGTVDITGPLADSDVRLVGVTSSRLGQDVSLKYRVCRFLCRSLIECRRSGSELLVASGSAIEPWAIRGSELYGVTCRRLAVDVSDGSADLIVTSSTSAACSVDAAIIALAERIDAVYVRRGGLIARSLRSRLRIDATGSVRVAVTPTKKCASRELMQSGAVGWIDLESDSAIEPSMVPPDSSDLLTVDDPIDPDWVLGEGQWLIHCTRAANGRWPGETERQYLDSILLGNSTRDMRGPLDALIRILQRGCLVAGARASRHDRPVVCFSSMSLTRLLGRRCFRSHLSRWDYEPFGIAIRTSAAVQQGVKPVIYGDPTDRQRLSPADRYRFHPRGSRIDWTQEQEWRSDHSLDLLAMDRADVRVFALDTARARDALSQCRWTVSFLSFDSKVSKGVGQSMEKSYNDD